MSVLRTNGPLVFGYNPQINFCHFFRNSNLKAIGMKLSHFSGILTMKVNEQWVPCVHNSSYSFMPIALKLYMCYEHGLKICMWFGYNPWIFFVIFSQFELSHFFRHFSERIECTLCAQLLLQFNTNTFETKRHHDHALKICMWFGYNPLINFCHFFRNFNLAIFRAF